MKRSKFTRGKEPFKIPLLRPLFEDMVDCEELLEQSDTQFVRRALVRAAFAFNEGYVYWLKDHVLRWLLGTGYRSGKIEVSKVVLLLDETYKPNQQGKLESEPNRVPFLNYCAFVVRTAAECWDFDPTQFFSDNGWCEMRSALAVRHRITHPKKPEDLEISDKELRSVSEADRWLFNCMADILKSISEDVCNIDLCEPKSF